MTISTLAGDASFLSAVNQYVRDDTEENKMGFAARTAALQQLYQSPMVEQYTCVAFFNADGKYFSSSMSKDGEIPDTSALLDALQLQPQELLISPQQDLFTPDPRIQVYGVAEPLDRKSVV